MLTIPILALRSLNYHTAGFTVYEEMDSMVILV